VGRQRAVLVAAVTVVLTAGGVAAASDWSDASHVGACEFDICGTVVNDLPIQVDVSLSWCDWKSSPCEPDSIRTLAPRSSSGTADHVDIDAFRVPDGLSYEVAFTHTFSNETTWLDPGWHKITTDTTAHITTSRPGPVFGEAQ
jgi:hypothetical protein